MFDRYDVWAFLSCSRRDEVLHGRRDPPPTDLDGGDGPHTLCPQSDRLASPRQCPLRCRKPPARRLDAAADRRHRCRTERGGRGGAARPPTSSGSGSSGTTGRCGRATVASATSRRRRPRRPLRRDHARPRGWAPDHHLASVVDDVHYGITHVIRGNDHRSNEALHRRLHEALGTEPPEYIHHGLVLGPDGKKLSKRGQGVATVGRPARAGDPSRGGARLPRGAGSAAT